MAGRGVVYYTMDMRTLSHGKIMAFLPGFQKVSPQMLLQETELKIERSGYVVLVVVTKSDIENYNGLKLLEISVGVATYRVSQSANADKLVTQTTDYTAAGGSARVFAYDQTMRDFVGTWRLERRESGNDMATLVELGLPETIGAGTGCSGRTEKTLQQMVSEQQVVDGVSLNELIDETSVDSTDTDAALLLVLAGGETESWLLLVRAGCSPDNTEVRGVGVCTCSPVDDKSYSIDFVTRVVGATWSPRQSPRNAWLLLCPRQNP